MDNFNILKGYLPGLIGRVAEMHAKYYSQEWNFGHYFEAKVATELSIFINCYDKSKDCIWSIISNGLVEGSITIDSSSEEPGVAHLRWFIVSDSIKGTGAGNLLMKHAIDFCKQEAVKKVYLWTFMGLNSAKYLYQKHGFNNVEELTGTQWGTTVTEQRYELEL
jgi:GNAT superfamily N-acetyltransferase